MKPATSFSFHEPEFFLWISVHTDRKTFCYIYIRIFRSLKGNKVVGFVFTLAFLLFLAPAGDSKPFGTNFLNLTLNNL